MNGSRPRRMWMSLLLWTWVLCSVGCLGVSFYLYVWIPNLPINKFQDVVSEWNSHDSLCGGTYSSSTVTGTPHSEMEEMGFRVTNLEEDAVQVLKNLESLRSNLQESPWNKDELLQQFFRERAYSKSDGQKDRQMQSRISEDLNHKVIAAAENLHSPGVPDDVLKFASKLVEKLKAIEALAHRAELIRKEIGLAEYQKWDPL